MKKYIVILTLFMIGLQGQAQQLNTNYIQEDIPQKKVKNPNQLSSLSVAENFRKISYQDGLGRGLQTVAKEMSPIKADMVTIKDYDKHGRESTTYLPFSSFGNNGAMLSNPISSQAAFYQTSPRVVHDQAPFEQLAFDNSPQNRVVEIGAPGTAFQLGTGNTQKIRYVTNTIGHPIRLWTITPTGNCVSTAIYPINELNGTHEKNEDNGGTYEFKDKLGRLVYRKVKQHDINQRLSSQNGSSLAWLETYFVYDDFGNLVFEIPPKAMALMHNAVNYDLNSLGEDLVFHYLYDQRQRLVEKKVPGKETEFIIYDNLDRIIMAQNGNQRANNQWTFNKYDEFGRPIIKGIIQNNTFTSRVGMQDYVNTVLAQGILQNFEKRSRVNFTQNHGYSVQSFPTPQNAQGLYEIHAVTWYDDYDFNNNGSPDVSWTADPNGFYTDKSFQRLNGKLTGTKIRILNRPGISAPVDWIETAVFYDQYGQVIHSSMNNHLGNKEKAWNKYDFGGRLTQSDEYHNLGQANEVHVNKKYEYDHAGRLLKIKQKNNNDSRVILAKYNYNEIGQQIEKDIHRPLNKNKPLQSVDMSYHIRGWLKSINNCDLQNTFVQGQKVWYADGLQGTIFEYENTNGEKSMVLDLTLSKCDQLNPNASVEVLQAKKEVVLISEATGDPNIYLALKTIEGQNINLSLPFLSMEAGPPIQNSEAQTAIEMGLALNQLSLTNANARAVVTQAACNFVVAQGDVGQNNNDDNDLFGMDIRYEEGLFALNGSPLYTGNISGVCWQSRSDKVKRAYGYQYDKLSRLIGAQYAGYDPTSQQWSLESGNYNLNKVVYGENGNIVSLERNGFQQGNVFGQIDDLRYKYSGNQLQAVTDFASTHGPKDFQDQGATGPMDYAYDADGNLISDANKAMALSYNYLDLPEEMDFGQGRKIEFLYAANGSKLRKVVTDPASQASVRDYLNGFVYQNGDLEFFSTAEGRVVPDGSVKKAFRYEYNYTDHLGNVRMRYSDLNRDGQVDPNSEILQEDHYYPFGMNHIGVGPVIAAVEQQLKYNGKEAQAEFGLHWADYGARFYDLQLGRWHSVDPLAADYEGWSPYSYVLNNPIVFVDPDGMAPEIGKGGKKKKQDNGQYDPEIRRFPQTATVVALEIRHPEVVDRLVSELWHRHGDYRDTYAPDYIHAALVSSYFTNKNLYQSPPFDDGEWDFLWINDDDIIVKLELKITQRRLINRRIKSISNSRDTGSQVSSSITTGFSAEAGIDGGKKGSAKGGASSSTENSGTLSMGGSYSMSGNEAVNRYEAKVVFEVTVIAHGNRDRYDEVKTTKVVGSIIYDSVDFYNQE